MKKAILKKTKAIIYIHEGKKPNMPYNYGMLVASAKPNSPYVFCVKPEDIIYE